MRFHASYPGRDFDTIAFRIAHHAFVVAITGAARPAVGRHAIAPQARGQRIDRRFVADA